MSRDSNCSIKIESKENKEIIDNESKKEEEKIVLNENKEEIINSKNDGNSFKNNNNENDDCLCSVTYSQIDLQENNEINNIGKSVEKEKLTLDENKEEINNLMNNGLNKINKDEFPKCNESLKLKDLEKFIIEKSSNFK